jgi:RHS repeat-associated protein
MDIDNNGLIEVVKLNQLGATNLTINKFINNAFVKSTHNFTVNRSTFKPVIGDFNGDGNSDFLLRLQGMSYEAMFFNRDAKNKKIVKIADGFSNILDFEYGNNEKRYENTVALGAHVFPCIKFQKNSLLTKVNYNNKILSNYWYNSGFYNRFGKGFIGFGVTTTSNVKYNLRSSIYILNSTADGNPLKIKQANYKYNALTGNTYLNETTSNFDYHFYANKRALAKLINDNSIDFETTFTSNNVYSYDIMNGNLTTKNTTIGDKTIIENYVYTYAPYSSWVKSLLTQQSSTVTKPGTSFNTSIKNYYNTNGSLNHIIKNQGTAFEVATYFETYDVYGNVKMSKMQAASLPNKTSNITYDSRGRFATSSKNNAGWITKYQTEPIYGGVIKTIDYNNRIVEHQYNGYGSNTKTIDALGNVKTNKVEWISVGGPPNTLFKKETSVNNKNYTYAYFTKDARQLRSQSQAFDGSLVNQDNIYNDDNSKTIWKASLPYFNGSTPKWITSTYDDYYRPVNETDPNGLMMKYVYEGAKTSITNPNGTQKEINVNEEGQTSKILENGATLKYIYHANSKPYIITNCGSATTFQYDLNGNKTLINDPNAGPTIYKTDAYGRLTYQKDANGNTSNFTFDNLDRLIQKQVSNPSSSDVIDYNYVYDSDLYNKGALNTESSNDETINYTYLASTGFLSEKTHTLSNGEQFTYQYKYNEEGDLINKTYPDLDFGIDFQYNALGSMNKMLNANDHSLIWQCDAKNETGSITQSTYGNGLIYTKTYDNVYNYLTKQQAATAIDMAYEWEPTTANLTSRKDNINALTEHFEYDSSDRLTSAKIDANPAYFNITYTNNGNIQQKSDIGVYNYDPTNKPNAVKHIDYATAPLPYPIPSFSQAVGYNILGKVNKIEENNNQVSLTYGCANQRALATYMHDGIIIKRKTYFPNYEKTIVGLDIKKELYISTPDGLASIYQKNIDGTSQMYYTYTDHLGSLTALTDATGTVLERLSYDAWGRRRSATDWAYEAPATSHLFDRGYTMHEHLDSFNIINMNGRIYDPLIGRMMQPDNYVQDATNTQSYNRYSYCWNNPMKYTDPSGDLVQLVIGGVIGGVSGYMIGKAKGATGWGMAGYIFGGVAIGAISGGVGSAVTSAVGSAATVSYGGLIAVGTGGATAGAISGAGFAALGGGNVGEGLWKGAVSGLSGGLVGGYITGGAGAFIGGATAGGVGSALNGGDINDIGKSALIGGGISLGSYQLQSAINYYDYKESGGTFTREQFKTVSRSAQKSFTRGKEYGGWLTSDGGVEMFPRGQQAQVKPQAKPNGATGFFHTHPNTGENWVEIHSPADVNFNNNYARVSSLVVGRQNTYMQLPGQNASLLSTNKIFNPYPFSYYWFR